MTLSALIPNRTRERAARKRITRERKTVDAMIAIFCHDRHAPGRGLCHECANLSEYARQRLQKCPFGDDKPTCAKCPIHCYKPLLRAQMQTVMRYAGPRMLRHRPILAIRHLLAGRKPAPEAPKRRHQETESR